MYTVDWVDIKDAIVVVGPGGEVKRITDYPRYFYVRAPDGVSAETFKTRLAIKVREATGTSSVAGAVFGCEVKEVLANSVMGYRSTQERFFKLVFARDLDQTTAKRTLSQCSHVADYGGSEGCVELFEANIPKTTRYLTDLDLTPHHYIDAALGNPPDLTIMSWDIEVYSHDNAFPVAERGPDSIEQIGVTLGTQRLGAQTRYVFTYRGIEPVDGVEIVRFGSEKELIGGFFDLIRAQKPSILTGYNVFGFDWDYILRRMKVLRMNERELQRTHRVQGCYAKVVVKNLSTAAYGANEYKFVDIPGVVEFDMLAYIRKEKKLPSYKLDSVAEELIGERKHDLPPVQIFSKLIGTDQDRAVVARYCVQDTDLVFKLLVKLRVVQNMTAMANVTYVPMGLLLTSGQQIKVKAQVLRTAKEQNKLLPTTPAMQHKGSYQGATVLDAKVGYYQDPVAGLDFASLYPSVMIAYNLSPDTVCSEAKADKHTVHVDTETYHYVKEPLGVLPIILQRLWARRKAVKRAMAAEKDAFVKDLLDSEQLAVKLSMNSMYGVLGSDTGFLPCKNVAASVTAMGRHLLEMSKKYVEANFPAKVVYGDSVAPCTTVEITAPSGKIATCQIQDLDSVFGLAYVRRADGKEEAKFPHGYTVRSITKRNYVRSVVRHYTNKQMYRVCARVGDDDVSVVVTEDHSLICEGGVAIRPVDMVPGETRVLTLQ